MHFHDENVNQLLEKQLKSGFELRSSLRVAIRYRWVFI